MRIHFIAIGGAIMHNLAIDLHKNGHTISGSDDQIFEPSFSKLKKYSLMPKNLGWNADFITDEIDLIILGMHAKEDNLELKKALELGLKIQSFPEFVASQITDKKRVAIAGSHGKTSTTAMLMHILKDNNFEFDYLVGSELPGYESMVKLSNAPLIVIEADEYLSSKLDQRPKFLWYKPQLSVITGIAWDHINVFPTFELYKKAFTDFIDSHQADSSIFFYQFDEELSKIINNSTYKCRPYTELTAKNQGQYSIVLDNNEEEYYFPFFGNHFLQNASAAIHLAMELGLNQKDIYKALESFPGSAKRLELVWANDQLFIYRDFAHSPSKVMATIKAFSRQFKDYQVFFVFEPHTFSSQQIDFIQHYNKCFEDLNAYIFMDKKAFALKNKPMLSGPDIENAFGTNSILNSATELMKEIRKSSQKSKKTVWVLMSSGNMGGFFQEIKKDGI